jgi:hypothetical protein
MLSGAKTSGSLVPVEQRRASEHTMKKRTDKQAKNELRPEYDLSKLRGGIRGKYLARYRSGTNLVLLSPDVAAYFPDDQSVNTALRTLIHVAKGPRTRVRHRGDRVRT